MIEQQQQTSQKAMLKEGLNIVIVGHVDHGKSTLIGRLLYESGALAAERIASVKELCRRQNREFEYAYFLDALEEEQAQNITIDTIRIHLETNERRVCIIDAPGHREFLKNMVSGAASADAAILIVDVAEGIQEQTKGHANILAHLGIQNVVVVINKMDKVNYQQNPFKQVKQEITAYLATLDIQVNVVLPVSARSGENLLLPSKKMPWYQGMPLIQELDHIPIITSNQDIATQPVRLAVQDMMNLKGERIYMGQIYSGQLKVGDEIRIEPEGRFARIAKLYSANEPVHRVVRGQQAGVVFHEDIFVDRGDLIVQNNEIKTAGQRIVTSVFWFHKQRLNLDDSVTVQLATTRVGARVRAIKQKIASSNLAIADEHDLFLDQGDTAEVTLVVEKPIFVDPHAEQAQTGRFVLRNAFGIGGGGIIKKAHEPDETRSVEVSGSKNQYQLVDTKKRSLFKALSWRILATLSTAIIAWFITSSFSFAIKIGIIDIILKLFLYYFHERTWLRIPFGKK